MMDFLKDIVAETHAEKGVIVIEKWGQGFLGPEQTSVLIWSNLWKQMVGWRP